MKMSFKLTPWILLFIIVLVLVISFFMFSVSQEGFSTFGHDKVIGSEFIITTYNGTSPVTKLYDNLFYDKKNGNLIEVVSSESVTGDEDPTSYSKINIISRVTGEVTSVAIIEDGGSISPQETEQSKQVFQTADKAFTYATEMDTPQYTVFVHATKIHTMIHIMTKTKVIATYLFSNVKAPKGEVTIVENKHMYGQVEKGEKYTLSPSEEETVTIINTVISNYDETTMLYLIYNNLYFDKNNGNLIQTNNTDGSIVVYNRDKTEHSIASGSQYNIEEDTLTTTFKPWFIIENNKMYLYVPFKNGTFISILRLNKKNETTEMVLESSKFFEKNDESKTISGTSTTVDDSTDKNDLEKVFDHDKFEEVTKMMNLMGYGAHLYNKKKSSGYSDEYSDDYILKTEVVPPVCPQCPSCSGGCSGVCNDCGGNGGSGTRDSNGNTMTDRSNSSRRNSNGNILERTVDETGNVLERSVDAAGNVLIRTVDTAGNVVEKTIDTAGNVVEKTMDAAGNVLSTVGEGAKTVASDIYGAATGTVSTVGQGAKTVAGDIYGATTGVVSDLYSGIKNLGSGATQLQSNGSYNNMYGNNMMYQQPQMAGVQTSNRPSHRASYQNSITNYDYYGALPSRTSNFVPVTANFSSFSD